MAGTEKKKAQFVVPIPVLPCPFCGATDVHGSDHDGVFPYIICEKCGASTGFARNQRDACVQWNRRDWKP